MFYTKAIEHLKRFILQKNYIGFFYKLKHILKIFFFAKQNYQ